MQKFYKHKLYKKYNDEIWGSLITSKKFSYNKRSVLLNYKNLSLRRRIRIRTKYRYFRKGFIKRLRYTNYNFKFFRRRLRLANFFFRKSLAKSSSSNSKAILLIKRRIRWDRWRFPKGVKPQKRYFIFKSFLFNKSVGIRGLTRSLFLFSFLERNNILMSQVLDTSVLLKPKIYSPSVFIPIHSRKSIALTNFTKFLRVNNMRFTMRKRLNLRREKAFFYSVHIAAPRKKIKKWSLYGLKNIYYKKVSTFFGFKKVRDFFKLYQRASRIWGQNESVMLCMLETRIPVILMRLNYFPSFYFLKRFILAGNILVNNKSVNYPNYFVSPGELLSFNKRYFRFVYFYLKSRLKGKKVLLNAPAFIEADYKLLVAMVTRMPHPNELTMPASFDLYTSFISFNR